MLCIGRLEPFQPPDAQPARVRGGHPVALLTAPDGPATRIKIVASARRLVREKNLVGCSRLPANGNE